MPCPQNVPGTFVAGNIPCSNQRVADVVRVRSALNFLPGRDYAELIVTVLGPMPLRVRERAERFIIDADVVPPPGGWLSRPRLLYRVPSFLFSPENPQGRSPSGCAGLCHGPRRARRDCPVSRRVATGRGIREKQVECNFPDSFRGDAGYRHPLLTCTARRRRIRRVKPWMKSA